MKARRRRRASSGSAEPPKIIALIEACPLFPPIVDGFCACGCGKALKGRRTRWYSRTCAGKWRTNHLWTFARRAARRRDKFRCVRCGERGATKRGEEGVRLEINHKVPFYATGVDRTKANCHNHLANLETLCPGCHAPITAAQAAQRAIARREAKAANASLLKGETVKPLAA